MCPKDVEDSPEWPLAYLITFRTYGSWLPGDARGTVDRDHHLAGQPYLPPDGRRAAKASQLLVDAPLEFNLVQRKSVETAIRAVSLHRGWLLEAIAVRSNHVHLVVSAQETPERVMNAFKSWGTRALNEAGLVDRGDKVWARHGSTRYLWQSSSLSDACRYVLEHQDGERFGGSEGEPANGVLSEPRL